MSETTASLAQTSTVSDVADSLTGYEEIGIREAFDGIELENLSALQTMRALFFTLKKREGHGHQAARSLTMEATAKEVADYFLDAEKADQTDPTEG